MRNLLWSLATLLLTSLAGNLATAEESTVKEGAKKVGQEASEVAHQIGEAGKEVGKQVAKAAVEVGHATRDTAKVVGKKVAATAVEVGHATRDGAKQVATAVKQGVSSNTAASEAPVHQRSN
jgi:hypothetical protein